MPWHDAFERLSGFAHKHDCFPPSPPTPLILAGWAYSNDVDKRQRWEETVAWAATNGCSDLVAIPDTDFYFTDQPTSHTVGPMGGPMYRAWDWESKESPPAVRLSQYLDSLTSCWGEVVGYDLGRSTRPLAFSGNKSRRLLVEADTDARPPWGSWSCLPAVESERRAFTRFRASINKAIAPHEVDHVDFVIRKHATPGT